MVSITRNALILSLAGCLIALPSIGQIAKSLPAQNRAPQIRVDNSSGSFFLVWPDGTMIGPIVASVTLIDGEHWSTTDFPRHSITTRIASPPGLHATKTRAWDIRSYGLRNAPELRQSIYLEPGQPFVLTGVEALSSHPISSRRIAPVLLAPDGMARFAVVKKPTVLFVPCDNDMWVRYNEPIDPASDPDSYEVTAIFDNATRKSMVLGSVTHDLWRTGILARNLGDGTVGKVEVYGGATGHWTHNVEPHGAVSGLTISSPLVMVGYFADWRDGLETYGQVNARIHPPLAWSGGVPFGWNSWAAYLEKVDIGKYLAAADFIHSQLEPRGFENHGTTYVNWDAGWTNVKEADLIAAARHLHAQGQKAGIYFTPFSYWSDDLSRPVEGTQGKYTYGDILLRDSKGNPLPKIDGARPLDPTHPGTIAFIDYELARFVAWGYDSVKLDFLNCGALEGHHYNPAIPTGVAAYAYGMRRIEEDLSPKKIGRPFFLSLSIAPLFPAYGHSRRISCDAFGRIDDTEYMLNAATFGWWTNGTLYCFNDPDHTVIARDQDPYHGQAPKGSVQTLEEARSRVNASVIAGTVLLDSDDLMDPRAQQRARELLTNANILNVAREGRSFRPVEGDAGVHAARLFTRTEPDGSMLVAAFNFSRETEEKLKIDLSRLGLDAAKEYRMTDLWTGNVKDVKQTFALDLGPAASKIVRFSKP
ncbi:MAG: alpha-galactosidase [Terracidiphilus sp.]